MSREKTGLYYLISIVTIRLTANVEVKLYIMKDLRNREFVESLYLHFRFTNIFTSRNCVKCVNQLFLTNVFFTDITFADILVAASLSLHCVDLS